MESPCSASAWDKPMVQLPCDLRSARRTLQMVRCGQKARVRSVDKGSRSTKRVHCKLNRGD